MPTIKLVHIVCAYLTGAGFLLRGVWALADNPLSQHRLTKVVPHIIDTLLLLAALGMLYSWSISLPANPWLVAKIFALLVYIGFGLLMLRWGQTTRARLFGMLGGVATYAYIVAVAHSKSVFGGLGI